MCAFNPSMFHPCRDPLSCLASSLIARGGRAAAAVQSVQTRRGRSLRRRLLRIRPSVRTTLCHIGTVFGISIKLSGKMLLSQIFRGSTARNFWEDCSFCRNWNFIYGPTLVRPFFALLFFLLLLSCKFVAESQDSRSETVPILT